MKILLGHVYAEYSNNSPEKVNAWINRLRKNGFEVDSFCISPEKSRPILYWTDLEKNWKTGDKALFKMYETLAYMLENYDVFLNYNGVNLYPDFVQQLHTFNVFACFDDPESSDRLSMPVAWAYDLAMVGNIAEVKNYQGWGVKEVRFWPLGFRAEDFDPHLSKEKILNTDREIDIVMLCEKTTPWRKSRLDKYSSVFPNGAYHGLGWPNGFLPEEERVPLLQNSKIGINIHNSSGPINFRTYYLPANGVLQLCDNKLYLRQIYELGQEVIGFETIEEAIELTKYYLTHEDERRQIAANGWERAIRDYNEIAVFQLLVDAVKELLHTKPRKDMVIYLRRQRKHSIMPSIFNFLISIRTRISKKIRGVYNFIRR